MRAGKLRKRISLETPSRAQNSLGEDVATFGSAVSRWASIEPLSGNELIVAQSVTPIATHKITLRHDTAITPETRIVWDSRTFNVISVINPSERNIMTVVTAKEEV